MPRITSQAKKANHLYKLTPTCCCYMQHTVMTLNGSNVKTSVEQYRLVLWDYISRRHPIAGKAHITA
eukprot:6419819-Amphidinium_carterae.1